MAKETLKKLAGLLILRKVKTGFGHDLAGLYCDVYMAGVKSRICYLNDDGWGGEVEIRYETPQTQEIFETFLKGGKVAQLMLMGEFSFLKTVDKIDLHCQAQNLIEIAVNLIEEDKFKKKIQKDCLTGIAFGTDSAYRIINYKMPLKAIVEINKEKGVEALQKAYDRAKSELKLGERILNTNLEELGVKF